MPAIAGDFHNEAHVAEKTKPNPSDSISSTTIKELENICPVNAPCASLDHRCIKCSMNESCVYGRPTTVKCKPLFNCNGSNDIEKTFICQYCYQTERWEHKCVRKARCNSASSPRSYYRTNCSVHDHVMCLGRRMFARNLPCNWTGGHRWSTAMLLSVTLGGFGADRFYLGYWQEGIGKLFSFGGLGVWTIIDFILISIQYLGPADGSLYI
ncbi:TM2 domain-containing protein 3 almondex [Rhodnius prolixus]